MSDKLDRNQKLNCEQNRITKKKPTWAPLREPRQKTRPKVTIRAGDVPPEGLAALVAAFNLQQADVSAFDGQNCECVMITPRHVASLLAELEDRVATVTDGRLRGMVLELIGNLERDGLAGEAFLFVAIRG